MKINPRITACALGAGLLLSSCNLLGNLLFGAKPGNLTSDSLLGFDVVDAQYSSSLDAVIAVSSSPKAALKVYSISDGSVSSLDLPHTPVAVSVSPDGKKAAVGYSGGNSSHSADNWVSYIALSPSLSMVQTFTLDCSLNSSNDVFGIALTQDHIYTTPKTDQWQYIRCVNVLTGVQAIATYVIYPKGHIKLKPGSQCLYAGEVGVYPPSIYHYDVNGDTLTERGDGWDLGGSNLWFLEDGGRIITSDGAVVSASDGGSDMNTLSYISGGASLQSATHSQEAGEITTIYAADDNNPDVDTTLHICNDSSYTLQSTIDLPVLHIVWTDYTLHGRFVFYSSDGSKLVVVAEADQGAGANPFVIYAR